MTDKPEEKGLRQQLGGDPVAGELADKIADLISGKPASSVIDALGFLLAASVKHSEPTMPAAVSTLMGVCHHMIRWVIDSTAEEQQAEGNKERMN